jgi:TonB-dependent receptor
MKKKILFLFLTVAFQAAFAQSAISGLVMDGDFNEPLAFANVIVREKGQTQSTLGSITDFEGRYSIIVKSEGIYEVEFSYLGYETKVISDVEVGTNDEVQVNVTLNPSSNQLEEVVITVSAKKNNEAAVLAIQKGAITLLDGLSAQTMKKSGDGDVAAAIKRIPGVSVQGGKFVYVRGLGDRYSKTLLGNVEVPGLDPDRNTLQLDVFPTNLIDNILISKSASADLPADFTGGLVDVILKDFSAIPEYSVSVSAGYNTSTNFKNAPTLPDYSLNALSFDSGANELPFNSVVNFPRPVNVNNAQQEAFLISSTNAFTKQMGVSRENNFMDYSIGGTASNQYNISEKVSIGFIASMNYKLDTDYYESVVNRSVAVRNGEQQDFDGQEGELGSIQSIASGLLGISLKTGSFKHNATILAIRSGESNGFDGIIEDYIENPYSGITNTMTHTEREILTVPFSGAYRLSDKFSFDWKFAPSVVRVRDIDFRKSVFNVLNNGNKIIDNSSTALPLRLWRDLEEYGVSAKADLKYDFKLFGKAVNKLKIGVAYNTKDREFGTDLFSIGYRGNSMDLDGNYDNILNSSFVWNATRDTGSFVIGDYQPTNQYEAQNETVGAYLSTELNVSEKLKATLGVRYEQYNVLYSGQDVSGEVYNDEEFIDVQDFYPSANFIYSVDEDTNIRASYSMTTARPSFKENSAANIYDPITERFFVGNVDLKPTYIDNFDVRWEHYGEENRFMAISGFYKSFENPIEINYFDVTTPNTLIARNTEEAIVYGVELEMRNSLYSNDNYRVSFNINSSLIVSKLEMSENELIARQSVAGDRKIDTFRKLQGQSPYLVNAGITYDLFESDFEAGLFYNVQGRALQVIGVGQFPDVFTEPFHSLNLNASKRFGENKKKTLTLKVDNLLNDAIESRFDYFGNTDFIFSSLNPGVNVSLAFGYKF